MVSLGWLLKQQSHCISNPLVHAIRQSLQRLRSELLLHMQRLSPRLLPRQRQGGCVDYLDNLILMAEGRHEGVVRHGLDRVRLRRRACDEGLVGVDHFILRVHQLRGPRIMVIKDAPLGPVVAFKVRRLQHAITNYRCILASRTRLLHISTRIPIWQGKNGRKKINTVQPFSIHFQETEQEQEGKVEYSAALLETGRPELGRYHSLVGCWLNMRKASEMPIMNMKLAPLCLGGGVGGSECRGCSCLIFKETTVQGTWSA